MSHAASPASVCPCWAAQKTPQEGLVTEHNAVGATSRNGGHTKSASHRDYIAMEPRPYNQSRLCFLYTWQDGTVDPSSRLDVSMHSPKCLLRGAVDAGVVVPWTTAVIARDRGVISQTDLKQEMSSQLLKTQGECEAAHEASYGRYSRLRSL